MNENAEKGESADRGCMNDRGEMHVMRDRSIRRMSSPPEQSEIIAIDNNVSGARYKFGIVFRMCAHFFFLIESIRWRAETRV